MPSLLLHPLTAVSQNLEIADRALPDFQAPDRADQISRYLEAQDDLEEGEVARHTTLRSRLGSAALSGSGIGGVMGVGKALPLLGAGYLTGGTAPLFVATGIGLGAGLGAGSQGLVEISRGPRLRKARATIKATPGWVRDSLEDPHLQQAGQAFKNVRRAPLYGVEAGLTAGGFLGAGLGAYLADRSGPRASLYGFQLPISQAQSAGAALGGSIGGLGVGALGLLAGVLIKARRRRQLLDQVDSNLGRKEPRDSSSS